MAFIQLLTPSPYRIRVSLDASVASYSPGILIAGNWSVLRSDGAGGVPITVTFAFAVDSNGVELALSSPLLPGVEYTVAESLAGSGIVTWLESTAVQSANGPVDDPEAEAFGIDYDWLAASLGSDGDMPVIKGRQCLLNDFVAIAKTDPGELYHRPTEGGGMLSQVNGPDSDLDAVNRALTVTWGRDPRARSVSVRVTADSDGGVTAIGTIQPIALDDSLSVMAKTG